MNSVGELYEQRPIMLWRDILAVGFLAEFHLPDVISASFEKAYHRSHIVRRVIKKAGRHQDRPSTRKAGCYQSVDAGLLDIRIAVCRAMPGIGRGRHDFGLLLAIGGMNHRISKGAIRVENAGVNFADGESSLSRTSVAPAGAVPDAFFRRMRIMVVLIGVSPRRSKASPPLAPVIRPFGNMRHRPRSISL